MGVRGTGECHPPAVRIQHSLGFTSAVYRGNWNLIQWVKCMEVGYSSVEIFGSLQCLLFGLSGHSHTSLANCELPRNRGVNCPWSWWTFLLPSIRERQRSLVRELTLKGERERGRSLAMEPELRKTKKFPLLPRPLCLGQAVHTRSASSLAVGKGNCSHREAGGRLSTDVPLVTSRLTTSKLFDRTYLPIPECPFSLLFSHHFHALLGPEQ